MSAKHFIAFDLGATSGRTILGTLEKDGVLTTKEITRFPNGMMEINGHLYWNIYSLYEHIREGLLQVAKTGVTPTSIGIDTWGVDFACIASDGSIIGLPHAYRDPQYTDSRARFFNNVMPASELYRRSTWISTRCSSSMNGVDRSLWITPPRSCSFQTCCHIFLPEIS